MAIEAAIVATMVACGLSGCDEETVIESEEEETYEPEGMSILGNSISTYEGWNPSGYAVFYRKSKLAKVEYTWWYRLAEKMGVSINANASWSGSTVSNIGASDDSYFTSDRRIGDLQGEEYAPKMILIAGGTNDWGHNLCELGEYDVEDSTNFRGAYMLMMDKIAERYRKSQIICLSIFPRRAGYDTENAMGWTMTEANASIERISEMYGATYVDMSGCGIDKDWDQYTSDGIHPTSDGMSLIADWIYEQLSGE